MRFKNVLIYPCKNCGYNYSIGGATCSFELAKILSNYFPNVLIYNIESEQNIIYNKSFTNIEISTDLDQEYNIENTLTIYGETVEYNPLNSKYVVRWILAPISIYCRNDIYLTWGKNDLVYYFNHERHMANDNIYKLLSCIHINPDLKSQNLNRNGTCFTIKKAVYLYSQINAIHPEDSLSIPYYVTQNDIVNIFNSKYMFISYDPLTFLTIMAPLCGCISIVYKSPTMSKEEWLKTIVIYKYLKDKNEPLYGIAYGPEEIDFAISTLHLVKEQWSNFQKYLIEKSIIPFVKYIENIDNIENKVINNYINK